MLNEPPKLSRYIYVQMLLTHVCKHSHTHTQNTHTHMHTYYYMQILIFIFGVKMSALTRNFSRKIHFLFAILQKSKTPLPNEYPKYDTKEHLMVRLQSWSFGDCGVPFHGHLSEDIFDSDCRTSLSSIYRSNRTNVLAMTLNFIWWWGSCPGALENVDCHFIAISLGSTLI